MTAVDETTDTRAEDAAWWAMDVVCSRAGCGRPAVWIGAATCGCSAFGCDPCKRFTDEHIASRAHESDLHCRRCGKAVAADFVTWRPL